MSRFIKRKAACLSRGNTKGEDIAAGRPCLPQRKTIALTLDPEPPEGGRGHSTRIKLGHQRRSPKNGTMEEYNL